MYCHLLGPCLIWVSDATIHACARVAAAVAYCRDRRCRHDNLPLNHLAMAHLARLFLAFTPPGRGRVYDPWTVSGGDLRLTFRGPMDPSAVPSPLPRFPPCILLSKRFREEAPDKIPYPVAVCRENAGGRPVETSSSLARITNRRWPRERLARMLRVSGERAGGGVPAGMQPSHVT